MINCRVAVLLSTYNGEKYIKVLLESLLKQINVHYDIFIRDDGSKDKTFEILNEYKKKGLINLTLGENIGPSDSFFELINSTSEYDFYALCDQDDYWLNNKLQKALESMLETNSSLYLSNVTVVNENLVKNSIQRTNYLLSFEQILLMNNATGCTMVFDNKVADYIRMYKPKKILMHDHWIYLLTSALNLKIFYDSKSYILYRKHSSNVIGMNNSYIYKFKNSGLYKNKNKRLYVAEQLFENYSSLLKPEILHSLNIFISYRNKFSNKIKLIANNKFRISFVKNIINYLSILTGRL